MTSGSGEGGNDKRMWSELGKGVKTLPKQCEVTYGRPHR